MGKQFEISAETVELTATDGVAFIEQASPLTRLHYFDGKALRADAFALEQDYHRTRTRLGNIAGGWGAVNGLGISLSGNELDVSAGLAITAAGNFVLATGEMHANLADLLSVAAAPPPDGSANFADCMEKAKPGVKETAGLAIYEITVGPVEGLCGNEPVYGKLCESACASDSRHPYWREGVVLRLRPVLLQLPASTSIPAAVTHLRNRVASAYFRAEPWLTPSALSASGLANGVWCQPATLYGRDEVVIGLLAREGGVNRVIDAWSGRRERMDTQARGYWQGRMAMRPWNVFVAQILQFQCQLSGLFEPGTTVIQPADDCDKLRKVLDKTRKELDSLIKRYGQSTKKILFKMEGKPTAKEMQFVANDMASSFADLDGLSAQLADLESGKGALPKQRMLLGAGFFELPPAGYLPVDPQASVEEQMGRMFGAGVHLHYHAVRHDEIAHLVEEAQHMDRISLTRGLDNPKDIEQVEIFVPDGRVTTAQERAPGIWWQVEFTSGLFEFDVLDNNQMLASGDKLQKMGPAVVPKSAAKRSAAAAAAASAANDPAAELQAMLAKLRAAAKVKPFVGLGRTETRSDGSFGITMVGTLDLSSLIADIRRFVKRHPELVLSEGDEHLLSTYEGASLYIAADIDHDPLRLPIGGQCFIRCELFSGASAVHRGGATLTVTMTAMADRISPSGRPERVMRAQLVLASEDDPKPTSNWGSISLALRGNAADGEFIVDDAQHDPSSSVNVVEWQDSPRQATMYMTNDGLSLTGAARLVGEIIRRHAVGGAASPIEFTGKEAEFGAKDRETVLSMTGLPSMPSVSSPIGSTILNMLVRIGVMSSDTGFLVRARQRLFPTLDTPTTSAVNAVVDWAMFRRARTHLCAPACATALTVEGFQVWHLKVDSENQFKKVTTALDNGDEKTLAEFSFKPVGVLHYRDESALSEEPADRVLAMWKDAKPAALVKLGRVWESAPATGQGWQNHFRLRNMIGQITSITKPPMLGDGALAAIPLPSSKLADGSLDGGMLVVTAGVEAKVALHRAVLLPLGLYADVLPLYQRDPKEGMDMLARLLKSTTQTVADLDLHFTAGQLDPADVTKLADANAKMPPFIQKAFRVDASVIDAGVKPAEQHKDITTKLSLVGGDDGIFKAPTPDLGNAAQVLTVVGYNQLD